MADRFLKMIEASHGGNVVHFPNAFLIERDGGSWTARIGKTGLDVGSSSVCGRGSSAEEAIEDLRQVILSGIRSRLNSSTRTTADLEEAMSKIADTAS